MRAGPSRLVVWKPIAKAGSNVRLRPTADFASGRGGLGLGLRLHSPKHTHEAHSLGLGVGLSVGS